jgi:DNA-binding MarR family transcriptional regulator
MQAQKRLAQRQTGTHRACPLFCPHDNGLMSRRTETVNAPTEVAEPPGNESAARVLRQFRQIFNAIKTHFQQVEREVGLGGAQVWALGLIRDNGGIGVSELARAMNIHQSTASNLVKVLVERELVTASKDAGDRRAVKLRLLPAGAKLIKRSPGPLAGVLPDALESLDPKTLKRLEADLAKLLALLKTDKKAAKIPLAHL